MERHWQNLPYSKQTKEAKANSFLNICTHFQTTQVFDISRVCINQSKHAILYIYWQGYCFIFQKDSLHFIQPGCNKDGVSTNMTSTHPKSILIVFTESGFKIIQGEKSTHTFHSSSIPAVSLSLLHCSVHSVLNR